jgi:hypothetical protein
MPLTRIASALVALLVSAGAVHCEPAEQAPPPAIPQPPAPPAEAPNESPIQPTEPSADGENMYTSGEVAVGAETDGYDDDDPAALSDFRPALEAHGAWVDDSTYGTVWVPATAEVGPDFRPYVSAGHWAYDDDWVWVSDYEWGWAPFHYGRWVWVGGRGWAWIPGRQYRGAWVTWGVDDGYTYVGWAPMPPAFVWFGGAPVVFAVYVPPRWAYCARGEVFSPVVRTRIVSGAAVASIATRVRPYVPATPTAVTAGPPPQRLGFQAAQIPRPAGTTAVGVERARQYSSPSSAQPLGARAPTRVPLVGQHQPGVGPSPGSARVAPGAGPSRVTTGSPSGRTTAPGGFRPPAHAAPAPHMQTVPRFHGAPH